MIPRIAVAWHDRGRRVWHVWLVGRTEPTAYITVSEVVHEVGHVGDRMPPHLRP